MADVHLDGVLFASLVVAFPGPERVRLMAHCRWCREVGFSPLLVHGHAGGHFVQLLKSWDPEKLIDVQIAVVALGGPVVRAQEVQSRAVEQNDGVASQLDANGVAHELEDVLLKHMRLGFRCRDKDLIAACQQCINEGLSSKEPGGPDLAGLQNDSGALISVIRPASLVVE